jgi:NhaP-type Na+/H+ or K+/H+ antiporter
MPWTLAVALGFCIGAVSPAVLVPSLMKLHNRGYGVEKGIPTTLIAASSFDDIIAITVFGVLVQVSFEMVGSEEGSPAGHLVLRNVLEITTGLLIGLSVGFLMIMFNRISCMSESSKVKWKFVVMVTMAVVTPYIATITHFIEAKFIAIIFYGYACNQVWKVTRVEDKQFRTPSKALDIFWKFCEPLLFGTVGASVKIREISKNLIVSSLLILVAGLAIRLVVTFLVSGVERGKFTLRERGFMAFSWIPKATV